MKQKIGNNSDAIIAGRDINIGLTYSDVKEIVYDLFKENFPKLVLEATTKSQENIDKYIEKLEENIKKRIDEINLDKFKEPNTQYLLNSSIKTAARLGDNGIDLNILSEALIASIMKKDSEILPLVAEQSLETLPRLTNDHIKILTLFQYLMFMRTDKITNFSQSETQHSMAYSLIRNISSNAFNCISYLTSIGILLYNEFQTFDIYNTIKQNHNYLLANISLDAFKQMVPNSNPSLKEMIDLFKKNKLEKVNITPVGSLIALINLRRVFGNLDYSHWIF